MSVYCAVCTLPFRPGEAFSLEDCHVVHRHCVGQRTQHDRMMDDIRRKVADLDAEMQRERMRAGNADQDHQYEIAVIQARCRTAQRQQERAEARTFELESENGRLRQEITQRVQPLPVATSAPEQEITPEAPQDDTAARFALLELE